MLRSALFEMGVLALLGGVLLGQAGDQKGEPQPPPPKEWEIPKAPVVPPERAVATFELEEGLRLELVAAEPLVEDPVGIRFDEFGRLWVLEMRSFMPNVDGTDEQEPICEIAVLTDSDGDGRMDERLTWLDELRLPRALGLWKAGALFIESPTLRYWFDEDGDLEPDDNDIVASGFIGLVNVEHAPNGLLFGLDNWFHLANHQASLRHHDGQWIQRLTSGGGQWGLSQDDQGRLFHNNNSDQLRADLIPGHYTIRNVHFGTARGASHRVATDQRTWPVRLNPGVNRGYRKGTLREDGTLRVFTAACSPHIYRGDAMGPAYQGNAFVCEPSGNLIKRNILIENDGILKSKLPYEGREFLASKDERFRPVAMIDGPDGALYIADLYRGILQHRLFVTTYLRKQILERGLDKPLGLGRIYRVRPDTDEALPRVLPGAATAEERVRLLGHQNGWVRTTTQRLLVQNLTPEIGALLRRELKRSDLSSLHHVHLLWALEGQPGGAPRAEVLRGLAADPPVAVTSLRLAEPMLAHDEEVFAAAARLATHPSLRVRWQLLLSLGEVRSAKAILLATSTLCKELHRRELRDAVVSGAEGRELSFLTAFFWWGHPAANGAGDYVRTLARCITRERDGERVRELLRIAAILTGRSAPLRLAILQGMNDAHPRRRPLRLDQSPAHLPELRRSPSPKEKKQLDRLMTFMTWPGESKWEDLRLRPLNRMERALFGRGERLYRVTCAGCHQGGGQGMPGLAPPLRNSEWVNGDVSVPVRIVSDGLTGPIRVEDQDWDQEMPGLPSLDHRDLAAILTFVRRSFGNEADPVTPDEVGTIRARYKGRQGAWTLKELMRKN